MNRLLFLCAVVFASCTDVRNATRVLQDAGYHPTRVGGYGWFDCAAGENWATRFDALSPDSTRAVRGCVCKGWLKGSTIRLD